MIKTSAKDLFFKAALCFLGSDDLVGAKRAIQAYQIEDPHFDSSRELEMLFALVDACEARSEPDFIKCVAGYVKMTPFDKVKNQLIARIKEIYCPDPSTLVAPVASKMSQIDFTGAGEEEPVKKKKQQVMGED